jgi:K+-transporting ATPase KdpF subunit
LLRGLDANQNRAPPSTSIGIVPPLCSEHFHDGRRHARDRFCLLRAVDWLRLRLQSALRGTAMTFDYALAGLVTAGLLFYLTYALLRPEQF